MVQKKKSRIQKRAEKEIAIVKDCKNEFDAKVKSLNSQRDAIRANIDLANEKIRNASDEETKLDIARDVKNMQFELKYHLISLNNFKETDGRLYLMQVLLKIFYEHRKFRFIVRKIPEKKLPDYVYDPDKVDRVYDLVNKLLEEVNDEMNRMILAGKISKDEEKQIEIAKEFIRESQVDNDGLKEIVNAAESEVSDAENYAKQTPAKNNNINRA